MNSRFDRDGYCLLAAAIPQESVDRLLFVCAESFACDATSGIDSHSVRARSSRGHVYAARNLIHSIRDISTVWQADPLLSFVREVLGERFGLVRALFFDKPPDRTWSLPWHKDTSIAVKHNRTESSAFSRPTMKAGVPHLIASDEILRRMLTLRIHLDDVTEENGPLRVVPGSHVSSMSIGAGINRAITIYAKAGDVLAMRPLISHASGSSISGTQRHRRILHLEFGADEQLPDGVEWHDFIPPAESRVSPFS